MLTTIMIIAIIVLAISEILFAVGFVKILEKIDSLHHDYTLCQSILDLNNENVASVMKVQEKQEAYIQSVIKLVSSTNKSYDLIKETLNTLVDHYHKLLEAWKHIDERYDMTYEEFKHCNEQMTDIMEKLSGPAEENFEPIDQNLIMFTYLNAKDELRCGSMIMGFDNLNDEDADMIGAYLLNFVGSELNRRKVKYKDINIVEYLKLPQANDQGEILYFSI